MSRIAPNVGGGEGSSHGSDYPPARFISSSSFGLESFVGYERVQNAIEWAAGWHRGQIRDGEQALPYVTHPIEVLSYLRHVGEVTDEDLLCTAVLHDLLEETAAPVEEIEAKFGPRVKALVEELTRREPTEHETEGLTKDEIWKLRAGMLVDEVFEMSEDAQRVKLADRLANVREAKRTKTPKKLARYLDQTREILRVVPKKVNPKLWKAIEDEL